GELPRVEGASPAERVVVASLAMHHVLLADDAATAAGLAARALAGGLVAEQGGDAISVYDAIYALLTADELDAAAAAADAALADARARGSRLGVARASAFRAQAHLRRGALADAESDARAALEVASGRPWEIVHIAGAVLAETLVERGRPEDARDVVEPGELPDTLMRNFGLWARARVRLALGDAAAAAADLRELARREARVRGQNPGAFPHRSLLALAERGEEARRLVEDELALATRWGAPTPVGRALRVLGLLEDDPGTLAEAVAVLARSPARIERARALCDLGSALARRGRRRDAREPLQEALELATRAGAATLAEHAREALLATGARPRRAVRSGVDALTPGELRVVRLAAAGSTNREIAQALFVTTRTVEVHLTHAYRKLGIAGRAELARTLADA
ncbi:MAG TPA: LuxR C-terminal-related transcriptional regulator, partial [Solirubrobacteraceae bacterium]